MTKKMQAYARQSAQRGLCAVLPYITHSIISQNAANLKRFFKIYSSSL